MTIRFWREVHFTTLTTEAPVDGTTTTEVECRWQTSSSTAQSGQTCGPIALARLSAVVCEQPGELRPVPRNAQSFAVTVASVFIP